MYEIQLHFNLCFKSHIQKLCVALTHSIEHTNGQGHDSTFKQHYALLKRSVFMRRQLYIYDINHICYTNSILAASVFATSTEGALCTALPILSSWGHNLSHNPVRSKECHEKMARTKGHRIMSAKVTKWLLRKKMHKLVQFRKLFK